MFKNLVIDRPRSVSPGFKFPIKTQETCLPDVSIDTSLQCQTCHTANLTESDDLLNISKTGTGTARQVFVVRSTFVHHCQPKIAPIGTCCVCEDGLYWISNVGRARIHLRKVSPRMNMMEVHSSLLQLIQYRDVEGIKPLNYMLFTEGYNVYL